MESSLCGGRSNYGQLGDGTNTQRINPVQVNLPSGVSAIERVADKIPSPPAVMATSMRRGWNADGQLGLGTIVNKNTPVLCGLQAKTIGFANIANRLVTTAPFTINATASSGLAVNFSVTNPLVCTVNVNTMTLASAGTCTIVANQSGSSNYEPAVQVINSFELLMPQTISFPSLNNYAISSTPLTINATV